MNRILFIKASPRGDRSYSVSVAEAFIDTYKKTNPDDDITILDIFARDLPSFDGLAVQAKYTILHGMSHSDEELAAWRSVEQIINEFKMFDKYIFAVPMWNFGIPYRLKQYLDILIQPTYTFSFSPEEGYNGLVTGKSIFVAYSRGGEYPQGSDAEFMDHQKKYLELVLGFIGFKDIRTVVVEPTLMGGPDVAKEKKTAAIAKAQEMAGTF